MQIRNIYEKAKAKKELLSADIYQVDQTINAHLNLIKNLKEVYVVVDNTPALNFSSCKNQVVTLLNACNITFVEQTLTRELAIYLLIKCINACLSKQETFDKMKANKLKEYVAIDKKIKNFENNTMLHKNLLIEYQKEQSEIENTINYLNSNFAKHQTFLNELSKLKATEIKYVRDKLEETKTLLKSAKEVPQIHSARTYMDAKTADNTSDLLALIYRNYTTTLKGIEKENQQIQDIQTANTISHLSRINRINQNKAALADKISKISLLLQEVPSELLQAPPEQQTYSTTPFSSQKNEMTQEQELDNEFNDFMRKLLENPTEDLSLPSVPLTLFSTQPDEDEGNEPQNTKRQKLK